MPSSLNGNPVPCSGRFLLALTKEGGRALFFFCVLVVSFATAQTNQKPISKKISTSRANEFTLAGLRPGRDKLSRAVQMYKSIDPKSSTNDSQTVWNDVCRKQVLAIDFDLEKKIQVIRAGTVALTGDCLSVLPSPWKTGLGLRVGDSVVKVVQLYGQPDSKSPSTRDGQPLELWYYAFDWAGPDVPQVMEVLCTREKDGQPGRVVEITLAAPSL
ncbi:MAG: hypothetical protein WB607_09045 [Candidatus Acidiferrum sp.]|jgi:hypothetical protein